jgi:chromosome segregation ATPase
MNSSYNPYEDISKLYGAGKMVSAAERLHSFINRICDENEGFRVESQRIATEITELRGRVSVLQAYADNYSAREKALEAEVRRLIVLAQERLEQISKLQESANTRLEEERELRRRYNDLRKLVLFGPS